MCQKRSSVEVNWMRQDRNHKITEVKNIRVDSCMRNIIHSLNTFTNFKTLACCCGHGRYPMTIVYVNRDIPFGGKRELFSGEYINNRKKFYEKDSEGYYYIPEVTKAKL